MKTKREKSFVLASNDTYELLVFEPRFNNGLEGLKTSMKTNVQAIETKLHTMPVAILHQQNPQVQQTGTRDELQGSFRQRPTLALLV